MHELYKYATDKHEHNMNMLLGSLRLEEISWIHLRPDVFSMGSTISACGKGFLVYRDLRLGCEKAGHPHDIGLNIRPKEFASRFFVGIIESYPPRIYCYRVIDEGRGIIFFEDILSTMNK